MLTNLATITNLQSLVYQLPTGDPEVADPSDGPKDVVTADFDQDQKMDLAVSGTDGTVTVYYGQGNGRFGAPTHLQTESGSLRGLVAADFNGDQRPDLAVAAPFHDRVCLFLSQPGGGWGPMTPLVAWYGARNLESGDFDGDGVADLIVAGPNRGVQQYRGLSNGTFQVVATLDAMNVEDQDPVDFPKPVYSLAAFRPAGAGVDYVAVTHADTTLVWLLKPNPAHALGALQVHSFITNKAKAHAIEIGPVLGEASTSLPDLISVQRDAGRLELHRGTNTVNGFEFAQVVESQRDVPGGPRAAALVDLDQDGWNDLVVVQRYFDSVITYANSNGFLRIATERPVGSSPRELAAARFDTDPYPDLVVINRQSADATILIASPQTAGYRGLDSLYLVDGNVAGLRVLDFNGDGYDDVIQLHRASGDYSVRLAKSDGTGVLEDPVFYTVGNVPSAQVVEDVNADGIRDQVTANLGVGLERGSVWVRLGSSDGRFGDEKVLRLPAEIPGRLFALVPGDFDKDGNIDLAAGFLDARLAFFQGLGDGTFTADPKRVHQLDQYARGLAAGDFDRDGDTDLAWSTLDGNVWVAENINNSLLTNTVLTAQFLPAPETNLFGVRTIIATDQNGDEDLDLVIGSGRGAWIYDGNLGMGFAPARALAGTEHLVSEILFVDLDNDNNKELILSCRDNDCLSFYSYQNGGYQLALPVDAPASKFIAWGYLDGDELPDLVGSGRVLWTALSGQRLSETPPLTLTGQRPRLPKMVINEVLARNTALPVDKDEGRYTDWIEIYNGTDQSHSLNGWKLVSIGTNAEGVLVTNQKVLPQTAFIGRGRHQLFLCRLETNDLVYITGWKIPADGGTLQLYDPGGQLVDEVVYPPQRENVSYSRFRDGLKAFVFNPFPSDEKANPVNGQVGPMIRFGGVALDTFSPDQSMRFLVDVADDVGISSARVFYNLLYSPLDPQYHSLYDDGLHQDGQVSDGLFTGEIPGPLPPGAEIQFYFEATSLSDLVSYGPDEPEFSDVDGSGNVFGVAVGKVSSGLEISEIVSDNETGLMDELNGTPDWVEVRNVSAEPVFMDGISLAHQIGENARYYFPQGTVLQPGEHFVVYCDNNPDQGDLHAPFRLSNSGESLVLSGVTANFSTTILDWAVFPELGTDAAYARLGSNGVFRITSPTPRRGNLDGTMLELTRIEGQDCLLYAFPTSSGVTTRVYFAPKVDPLSWVALPPIPGDGVEKVIKRPLGTSEFFHLKRE